MKKNQLNIAIIGAGMSGISLASSLQEIAKVKIFEKSRGIGGRMSTRHAGNFNFDHGLQCFTARGKPFQKLLRSLLLSGDVAFWKGKIVNISNQGKISERFWFENHLVAVPNMNSLCKKLADGLDIIFNTEVAPLQNKKNDGWHLKDKNDQELGAFDLVIVTAPPAQTKKLLGENFLIKEVAMKPCFSLMLGFNHPWQRDWIFAKIQNNPVKLIAVNSTKPGRNQDLTCLVVHARDNWSSQNLDSDRDLIKQTLLENFTKVTGIDGFKADYINLHLWRYALVEDPQKTIFFDPDLGVAATGDWVCNSRIEDVWLAATRLAEKIKNYYLLSS